MNILQKKHVFLYNNFFFGDEHIWKLSASKTDRSRNKLDNLYVILKLSKNWPVRLSRLTRTLPGCGGRSTSSSSSLASATSSPASSLQGFGKSCGSKSEYCERFHLFFNIIFYIRFSERFLICISKSPHSNLKPVIFTVILDLLSKFEWIIANWWTIHFRQLLAFLQFNIYHRSDASDRFVHKNDLHKCI